MYITDFEYDGISLSSMGFIPCTFDSTSGVAVVDTGANATFNKVSSRYGRKYHLAGTRYDSCAQIIFDICRKPQEVSIKDFENGIVPTVTETDDKTIGNMLYVTLRRWLCRTEFKPLKLICDYYESNTENGDDFCFYNGTFTVDEIKIGDTLYGLRLTFEADSPFGYRETTATLNYTAADQRNSFIDESDVMGYNYPTFIITCKQSGDLTLTNRLDGVEVCSIKLTDCGAGEIITIDGENQIISTTSSKNIANRFNYVFPTVGNSETENTNVITASQPCTLKIVYKMPILKII